MELAVAGAVDKVEQRKEALPMSPANPVPT